MARALRLHSYSQVNLPLPCPSLIGAAIDTSLQLTVAPFPPSIHFLSPHLSSPFLRSRKKKNRNHPLQSAMLHCRASQFSGCPKHDNMPSSNDRSHRRPLTQRRHRHRRAEPGPADDPTVRKATRPSKPVAAPRRSMTSPGQEQQPSYGYKTTGVATSEPEIQPPARSPSPLERPVTPGRSLGIIPPEPQAPTSTPPRSDEPQYTVTSPPPSPARTAETPPEDVEELLDPNDTGAAMGCRQSLDDIPLSSLSEGLQRAIQSLRTTTEGFEQAAVQGNIRRIRKLSSILSQHLFAVCMAAMKEAAEMSAMQATRAMELQQTVDALCRDIDILRAQARPQHRQGQHHREEQRPGHGQPPQMSRSRIRREQRRRLQLALTAPPQQEDYPSYPRRPFHPVSSHPHP